MCKIMAIVGLDKDKTDEAWEFSIVAAKIMSAHDKDGFGYAAITKEGTLFGERWIDPTDAFVNRQEYGVEAGKVIKDFQGAVTGGAEKYNAFGTLDASTAVSILLHTRMATCAKTLTNTHPFLYQDHTALIHNGIISNAHQLKLYTSTCDSETILNSYVEEGVDIDAGHIQAVADALGGSYACAVAGTDPQGVPFVDIFKNNSTNLIVGRVTELGCLVFCTNVTILQDVCDDMGYTLEFSFAINAEHLIRMNAVSGEVMSVTPFSLKTPSARGGHTHNVHFRDEEYWAKYAEYEASTLTQDDGPANDDDITAEQVNALLQANLKEKLEADPFYVKAGN